MLILVLGVAAALDSNLESIFTYFCFNCCYYSYKNNAFAYLISSGRSGVLILCIFRWWMRTCGGRPLRTHTCCRAYSGVILFLGSITRHFCIKSVKSGSSAPNTRSSGFPLGLLNLPLEFLNIIGSNAIFYSLYLKNLDFRCEIARMSLLGMPTISIILHI